MRTKLLILAIVVAVPAASVAYFLRRPTAEPTALMAVVTRSRFEVVVRAKGKVVAAKSIGVSCPVWFKPIVWLIPEGAMVKKGDLIVKFDKREIEEGLRSVRAWHRIATARLREAEQQLKAGEQEMHSRIKTFEAQLHIAQLEVQDLKARPRPDDLERAMIELKRAKAVLEAAKAEYDAMKAASDTGPGGSVFTPSDLRAVRLTYEEALADLKASQAQQRAVAAGAHPDTIEEAELKQKQAELDLDQAKKEFPDKVKQFNASIEKTKAEVDKAETQLKRNDEELADADFEAPADGMIAYRPIFGKRLAKGMTMWKGATILDLPDLSRMQLRTRVRESEIAKVAVGQTARLRVHGVPDKVFDGKVVEIGKVAKDSSETEAVGFAQERKDTGIRVFDVVVEVVQSDTLLKPNMLGTAEIVVWSSDDALSVPLDAIFKQDDRNVAYVVHKGRVGPVEVEVGHTNWDRAAITKGLEEGQQVCLSDQTTEGAQ